MYVCMCIYININIYTGVTDFNSKHLGSPWARNSSISSITSIYLEPKPDTVEQDPSICGAWNPESISSRDNHNFLTSVPSFWCLEGSGTSHKFSVQGRLLNVL